MDEQIARQLMEKVKHDYESIAEDFSQTRQNPWQEFSFFESFLHSSDRVLDLGCGNGRLLDFLHGKIADYTGLDISQKLLQKARKKYPHERFVVGDMMSLPFPDASFDIVFCIASLHHIPSRDFREKVISEIQRVLKPQGFFMLTVWNLWQLRFLKHFRFRRGYDWNDVFIPWKYNWKYHGQHQVQRYYHAFTFRELQNLLRSHGFYTKFAHRGRNFSFIGQKI